MEIQMLEWIQMLRNPVLDSFFEVFTSIGNRGEIWLACILMLAVHKKTRKIALLALLALLIQAILVNKMIKPIVMRPRPFTVHMIDLIINPPSGWSFPSGHAASGFAVAGVFWFSNLKTKWLLMLAAVLMAFSRLYLFVHYPSDVVVGSLIGLAVAWCICRYKERIYASLAFIRNRFKARN